MVREVASLTHRYGLIRKGNEPLIPNAIRMLMGIRKAEDTRQTIHQYFELAGQFREIMARTTPAIHFAGVWDTASSVGWIDNPLHLPCDANNPDIEIGRHAVSVDEHRVFFRSHLWKLPDGPAKPGAPPRPGQGRTIFTKPADGSHTVETHSVSTARLRLKECFPGSSRSC